MEPRKAFQRISSSMNAAVIGQESVVERLLIAFLADGHVLMEGLPGRGEDPLDQDLGKSYRKCISANSIHARSVAQRRYWFLKFIVSKPPVSIFNPGPIFGNLVLADEINRAPAKVQAALLEAMEERQVTVAGTTHKLPALFLVLATQNPIEQEGTYPLPEAQMDRFLLYVNVPYPPAENEAAILRLVRGEKSGSSG